MDLMSNTVELEQWARALEDSGDYRVLRRLPIQEHFGAASANQTIQVLVVDTETTGTLFSDDALIEFSGLKVLCLSLIHI